MPRKKLRIGDKIRVIAYRPVPHSPGYVDDMGTEALFQRMVGRRYTIQGFDEYGQIELSPTRRDTVWIEPDLVRAVKSRPRAKH